MKERLVLQERAGLIQHRHCYAKWVALANKIRILQGTKQILEPINVYSTEYFKFYNFRPGIMVGSFKRGQEIQILKTYDQVKARGFLIKSYPPTQEQKRFIKGLRNVYKPIREQDMDKSDNGIPIKDVNFIYKGNKIEYDITNKAMRIYGPNGSDEWIFLHPVIHREKGYRNISNWKDRFRYLRGTKIEENPKWFLDVKEIILGISHATHELICLPDKSDRTDTYRIGLIGDVGGGKTLFAHEILDQKYQKGIRWVALSDTKGELFRWSLPAPEPYFHALQKRVNYSSAPLPIIPIHPKTYSSKRIIGEDEGLDVWTSLSWSKFLDRYNEMTKGAEEFKMGRSRRVFTRVMEKLKKLTMVNEETILQVLIVLESEMGQEIPKGTKERIAGSLASLAENGIFDVSKGGVSSTIIIKRGIEEPIELPLIIGILYIGLCGIFIPEDLNQVQMGSGDISEAYVDYHIREIIDYKRKGWFKNEEIFVYLEELWELLSRGVSKPILDLIKLGRSEGIGVIWTNQEYLPIRNIKRGAITNNTTYFLVMNMGDGPNIHAICKDNNGKDVEEDIINLGTKAYKHECYVLHKKEALIGYDLDNGEKRIIKTEPRKIELTPGPLSAHEISLRR